MGPFQDLWDRSRRFGRFLGCAQNSLWLSQGFVAGDSSHSRCPLEGLSGNSGPQLCMFCMEPSAGFALLAIPKNLGAGRDLFQHQGQLLLLPLPWKTRSCNAPTPFRVTQRRIPNLSQTWKILIFHTQHAFPTLQWRESLFPAQEPSNGRARGCSQPQTHPKKAFWEQQQQFPMPCTEGSQQVLLCLCTFRAGTASQGRLFPRDTSAGSALCTCRIRFPAPGMFLFRGFCCRDVSS